jgi:hypothetical protein
LGAELEIRWFRPKPADLGGLGRFYLLACRLESDGPADLTCKKNASEICWVRLKPADLRPQEPVQQISLAKKMQVRSAGLAPEALDLLVSAETSRSRLQFFCKRDLLDSEDVNEKHMKLLNIARALE